MSVHDVPRVRWAKVLELFSNTHRGWLTRVTRVGPGPELLSVSAWLPLEAVDLVANNSHGRVICVRARGAPTVCVSAPRTLAIDRVDGAVRGLEIDAPGGEFVRVAFRVIARPEELDGMAPAELAAASPH